MRICVLQSCHPVFYDPNNPGIYDKEYCLKIGEEFYDSEFKRMEDALSGGVDLLVTIEAFNYLVPATDTRYRFSEFACTLDGELVGRFLALSKKYNSYIIAGLYTLEDGKVYNSAILCDPKGEIAGVYHKVHLPAEESSHVTPGNEYKIFETQFGNIGPLICWDLQYPEAARALALMGADIIVCPTWGCEFTYVPARAYENSVTLAVAMATPKTGMLDETNDPSCIVNNMGKIVAVAKRVGEDVLFADIDIRKEPDPQYGSELITGHTSMRRTRLVQRRPDTYSILTVANPPLKERYEKQPVYS